MINNKMMHMKCKWLLVVFSLILCMGCNDEESLTTTGVDEFKYTLPQGDHDYDEKIMSWHERCGFYILYQFEPKDIYFNNSDWITNQLVYTLPDENYVGKQLELIEDQLFRFYPDSILRRCMPMKLLLTGSLKQKPADTKEYHCFSGFDCFIMNWGKKEVEDLTAEEKLAIRKNINFEFLSRLMNRMQIVPSEEFASFYNYNGTQVDPKFMYEKGLVNRNAVGSAREDFLYYLEAIVNFSYEELTEDNETLNVYKGILHPVAKDKNGLIRKKYDILVRYMKERYGIDVTAIAN